MLALPRVHVVACTVVAPDGLVLKEVATLSSPLDDKKGFRKALHPNNILYVSRVHGNTANIGFKFYGANHVAIASTKGIYFLSVRIMQDTEAVTLDIRGLDPVSLEELRRRVRELH